MLIHHLITGARGALTLVRDDEDRRGLLALAGNALGRALLAYCVMDTHLHLVAEVGAAAGRRCVEEALALHARRFHRRHGGGAAPLLRGPVEAFACPGDRELARLVRYVHANPLRTTPPLAARAVDFRWSSARAFAGLSRAAVANVERARALLGEHAARALGDLAPRMAGLEPARWPTATPADLLAAAAEVHGLDTRALAGEGRAAPLVAARALYVRLGLLEAYSVAQLAGPLARSRSQAYRLLEGRPAPDADVRAARTLLRDPGLRARLPA